MNQFDLFLANNELLRTHPVLFWAIPVIVWTIIIWTFFWKGYAIWTAAKNGQKTWFVVLLVVNTIGILEIFYLFKIAKKNWIDIKTILFQKV